MDNDLPMYQTKGEVNLSGIPMDEQGLYILSAIPDLNTMRAAAKYNQGVKGFLKSQFDQPRVEVYRTQQSTTPAAMRMNKQKVTPEMIDYYQQMKMQDMRQDSMPGITSGPGLSPEMKAALNTPYGERKYGGVSNPFSNKRQLRKKRGGQIANISTDVLKRLQEEANKNNKYKFNTL